MVGLSGGQCRGGYVDVAGGALGCGQSEVLDLTGVIGHGDYPDFVEVLGVEAVKETGGLLRPVACLFWR